VPQDLAIYGELTAAKPGFFSPVYRCRRTAARKNVLLSALAIARDHVALLYKPAHLAVSIMFHQPGIPLSSTTTTGRPIRIAQSHLEEVRRPNRTA